MPSQIRTPGSLDTVDNPDPNAIGPWINAGNAATSNDTWAVSPDVANSQDLSDYLWSNNYGFTIPGGATINGIEVEIEIQMAELGHARAHQAKLIKGGTISGIDWAGSIDPILPGSDTIFTLGSPTHLWDTVWTPSDINSSSFGFVYVAGSDGGLDSTFHYVDMIRVTVYYTPLALTVRQLKVRL